MYSNSEGDKAIRELQKYLQRLREPVGDDSLWATDTDRNRIIRILQEAYAQGCITQGEFEKRMGEASRIPITRTQLQKLTTRLPVHDLEPHSAPAPVPRRKALIWEFIPLLLFACAVLAIIMFVITMVTVS